MAELAALGEIRDSLEDVWIILQKSAGVDKSPLRWVERDGWRA